MQNNTRGQVERWDNDNDGYLVASQDAERLHDLLRSVCVGRLACHEVEERVECDVTHAVWVDSCHDSLEVSIALSHARPTTRLFLIQYSIAGNHAADNHEHEQG